MAPKIHQDQNMGKFQNVLPQSVPRTNKSGNHRRERGQTTAVQRNYCITPPPPEEHHKTIDYLKTIFQWMQNHSGTGQCSPHRFELISHGTISANECINEWNSGATEDSICDLKKSNNNKEKILLLKLWKQLHSWDQKKFFQEKRPQRGGLQQQKNWR